MKILADINIPYLKGVIEPFYEIEYLPGEQIDNESLKAVEILIIRTRTKCDENLLHGSKVRLIVTATIGYDHIDTKYCDDNDIKWVNAPGCNSGGVQQWFMAALLLYAKENDIDLTRRTMGIVGIGNVGSKIVKFADALGMFVILNDPPREEIEGSCIYRGIETIQRECDIISFHVPLNYSGKFKTLHMVNQYFLSELSPNTILINSSRGEVMNSVDITKAWVEKRIQGVLLDVWENEPHISKELLNLSSIATPHIAGYSMEGKADGTAAAVKAVGSYLGLPFEDWFPDDTILSAKKKIKINCNNRSLQEVITEAVLQSYSIRLDDAALREHVDSFEDLRSEYIYRHEPSAYFLELTGATEEVHKALQLIGFSTK